MGSHVFGTDVMSRAVTSNTTYAAHYARFFPEHHGVEPSGLQEGQKRAGRVGK